MSAAIVWLRNDLRLTDNPALYFACQAYQTIYLLYIYEKNLALGAASQWWLHHSIKALQEDLLYYKQRLLLKQGNALEIFENILQYNEIKAVYWNRRYEAEAIAIDSYIKKHLQAKGLQCHSYNGTLLLEPWENIKTDNSPYKIFTPFYKAGLKKDILSPLPIPDTIPYYKRINNFTIDPLEQWSLLPNIRWDKHFSWQIGEQAVWQKLLHFSQDIESYAIKRDFPALSNTSILSPHLHFGEISVRQIWYYFIEKIEAAPFLRQLFWRDFAYHLLYYFPETVHSPLNKKFLHFSWQDNMHTLHAWQKGETGIPIIDAGMRQLWLTGWMHNRVRMIVGSLLVKNMQIHWLEGADWFFDTLVDADIANNILGWQWVSGCGADAAPYFRVFNPILQSKKFDPQGDYIKTYLPELSDIPDKYIADPWQAPELLQNQWQLEHKYPKPILDIKQSRESALAAYNLIKNKEE